MVSILIIDDNELVRGFLRTVLEGAEHTVVEASQGRERRDFQEIKILAITGGSGDKNLLTAARKLGAAQVLAKPISVETLLKAVERTLAGIPQPLA